MSVGAPGLVKRLALDFSSVMILVLRSSPALSSECAYPSPSLLPHLCGLFLR